MSILFDDDEVEAASHWYGGQGSTLYAIVSTGALRRGTIRPRSPEGGLMTDDEWIVDLAERLESEAEDAARDAAQQAKKAAGAEKKELLADRKGLLGIVRKAKHFIRARAQKPATARHHATMKTKALTKSPAQLDREIAETLKAAPRSAEKPKRYRLTIAGPTGRYTESAITATEDQAIAAARRELESGAVHVRVETGVDYLLGTASTLVANLRK